LSTFPKFNPQNLKNLVPRLEAKGIDLLGRFLQMDPYKRISCKEAIKHPYFADLEGRHELPLKTPATAQRSVVNTVVNTTARP